ncbi:CAH4 anhydrase, partial [Polyodon spathula]|nr:CAH4 anhydrase [Polyodon spathula]
MELHIVHLKEQYHREEEAVNDAVGFAVLGFLFEESGEDNPSYKGLIDALGRISHYGFNTTVKDLRLDDLIPKQEDLARYYRYEGSLTTPGCNEAVVWTLFEKPIPLSRAQLTAFSQKLFFNTGKPMERIFRPVQQAHGRTVYRSSSSSVLASTAVLSASIISTLGFWSFQFLDLTR